MQHMKAIGTNGEAMFIPAAFGTSKGATAKASFDSLVLKADLPRDTNVGGTLEEERSIDIDLLEELDLALEDEAYIENDEIDFFDAIVGATEKSNQRENNIPMALEKPQIIPIIAENRKQQDNGPPKVKFALPSDQQLDEILKEYEDEAISLEDSLKTHSFENKGDANDAGSVLNDQHFDSILDQFLNENRGCLAERPFKTSPVESPSCPTGTKLGKKERMFSRAVEEMDALRHALEGVRIVPTNYRFELGSNEEEEIDSEQSLCELKDWNPTDETLEEFSSSTAFFSLMDEETPRMISNLPKTIREIPSLKPHTRKSASTEKSTATTRTPESECVLPKGNLGKARPKDESPVEKKARKLAAKALKKKIPVSIK